jgi:hypothetical protein
MVSDGIGSAKHVRPRLDPVNAYQGMVAPE